MKTDLEILNEGVRTLFDAMDVIDAERFIMLIKRNNFDYTEWQRRLWSPVARNPKFEATRRLSKLDL